MKCRHWVRRGRLSADESGSRVWWVQGKSTPPSPFMNHHSPTSQTADPTTRPPQRSRGPGVPGAFARRRKRNASRRLRPRQMARLAPTLIRRASTARRFRHHRPRRTAAVVHIRAGIGWMIRATPNRGQTRTLLTGTRATRVACQSTAHPMTIRRTLRTAMQAAAAVLGTADGAAAAPEGVGVGAMVLVAPEGAGAGAIVGAGAEAEVEAAAAASRVAGAR